MGVEKNLSDALGIEYVPAKEVEVITGEVGKEIVTYDPSPDLTDEDEDYILVRKTLRNLIVKGNDAIEEIAAIARQNESARGFEVVSNLIKTVGETSKDLYALQKTKKDLKDPNPDSDPRKKNAESNINVEQAVFVGSAAELLSAIKKQKEDNG
jgi:hypothetical protein